MPVKAEVNCDTGEVQYIELTPEEVAEMEADALQTVTERNARLAEIAAKEAAKQSAISKLTALGLTEEEAIALAK